MADLNGVMMQYFHWYIPADGTLWNSVSSNSKELAEAGITALWLPPAYKGVGGGADVGYGVYDLYDLGEFDQKGSIRTKYGTRQQYLDAVAALKATGLQVYADGVLNHRMGADKAELSRATPYSKGDRINPKGPQREIMSWTHFTFPGRIGKHSDFEWHWHHFDAVDFEANYPTNFDTIYLFDGKYFDDYVSQELGNFALTYTDITGYVTTPVTTNNDGWGEFKCIGGKVSVWTQDLPMGLRH